MESSIGLQGQQPADKLNAAECKRSSSPHPISITPERPSSKPCKVNSTTAGQDRERERERERRSSPEKIGALLHTGGILGDLPSFNTDKIHRSIESISKNIDYVKVLGYGDNVVSEYPTANTHTHTQGSPFRGGTHTLDSRADAKDKIQNRILSNSNNSNGKNSIKQMRKRDTYVPPEDFPPSYLCELSHRPMSDPVQSIYGNIFDRPTIIGWIRKQGHVCPLSGTCRAHLLNVYVYRTTCIFAVIAHFLMYLLYRQLLLL